MELPHLGARCAVPDCRQLDFLPFPCAGCGRDFCGEHRCAPDHACPGPPADPAPRGAPQPAPAHRCSAAGCAETSPVEMPCPACARHYCLAHRHHGCREQTHTPDERRRWEEPQRRFAAAKALVDREVEASLQSARGKASETARKVQLMRLKAKAVGPKAVPPEQRAYFSVRPLAAPGQPGRAVYASRRWPLGRALDAFSDALGVASANNKPGARLRLLREGEEICADLSRTLDELIQSNAITEGDTLSLEFIYK
ncbi:AN1-type zinc finger protein 1-like [Bacillus rossius redtenbacheri]|uniref:AN1-type zinc finger protein 1-like n=1 Tax=Bacillus rossius redtenbacheri TaxID=93214 RepID=UPI002FDF03A2